MRLILPIYVTWLNALAMPNPQTFHRRSPDFSVLCRLEGILKVRLHFFVHSSLWSCRSTFSSVCPAFSFPAHVHLYVHPYLCGLILATWPKYFSRRCWIRLLVSVGLVANSICVGSLYFGCYLLSDLRFSVNVPFQRLSTCCWMLLLS